MGCTTCEERREMAANAIRAVREKNARLAARYGADFMVSSAKSLGDLMAGGTMRVKNSHLTPTPQPDSPRILRVKPAIAKEYARPHND